MTLSPQVIQDLIMFGVAMPTFMYCIGKYVHHHCFCGKPKYHWYLLLFYSPTEQRFYKSYRGFNKNQVSLRSIMHIKSHYNLSPNYLLLQLSYLGRMTAEEFGDTEVLHSLNVEIQTH